MECHGRVREVDFEVSPPGFFCFLFLLLLRRCGEIPRTHLRPIRIPPLIFILQDFGRVSIELPLSREEEEFRQLEEDMYSPRPATPAPVFGASLGGEREDGFVAEVGEVFERLEGDAGEDLGCCCDVGCEGGWGGVVGGVGPGVDGYEAGEAEGGACFGEEGGEGGEAVVEVGLGVGV